MSKQKNTSVLKKPSNKMCETCEYYRDHDCKRYPRPVEKYPEDWCGEWRERL
jgi:hypothetical protein